MDNNQVTKTNFNLIAYLYEIAIAEQRKAELTGAVKSLELSIDFCKRTKRIDESKYREKQKTKESLQNSVSKANIELEEIKSSSNDSDTVSQIVTLTIIVALICCVPMVGVLFGVIIGVLGVFSIIASISYNEKESEKKRARVEDSISNKQDELVKTEKEIKAINGRLKDNDLQIQSYMSAMSELNQILSKTEKRLDEIYGLEIIDLHYRNADAICFFIHYLQSGICEKLTGVDGAYRLYEMHSQTDVIIGNVEKITRKINELCNSLNGKLEQIPYDLKENFKTINEVIATQTFLYNQKWSRDNFSRWLEYEKKFQEIDNDQSTRFQRFVKEKLQNL